MPIDSSLSLVLTRPSPDSLWKLRAALLIAADEAPRAERSSAERSLAITGQFYQYLVDLQSKMSAHEYSQIATHMDIGSVGLLALQDLVADRGQLFKKLMLGGLSEGLMVLAALQYTKAWQTEVTLVNDGALWWLYDGLWQVSLELRPDLPPGSRCAQIEALLGPVRSSEVEPAVKAAIIARLFQVLLLGSLAWVPAAVVPPQG